MDEDSRLRTMFGRILAMLRRPALDRELDEELRSHLEMAAEENQRRGMAADEAWRKALRDFGGVTQVRETVRVREGVAFAENLRRDLGYALRMLKMSPGFAAIAIGSLALGIGANTAIFSIAKQVLLDRLNVPHAGELRLFVWRSKRQSVVHSSWGDWDKTADGDGVSSTSFSYPVYQLMRKQNHELADLFAFKNVGRMNVTVDGEAEVAQADLVSGNFYEQMDVQPQLGRAIGASDDEKPGGSPVVVISDGYWTRRFNRSPTVIGKTILVNLVNVTIVGVNPRGFTGAKGTQSSPEIFLPFSMQPLVFPYSTVDSLLTSDRVWWMQIMARAKPGVDEARARAALDVALKSAVRATMTVKPNESVPDLLLTDGSRGMNEASRQMARPLFVLMSLVGLVVLLACANMANLLLARSAARQREMSVRMALGAGRARILRQVMTESLLLAMLGGVAGLLVGYFGRNAILAMLSSPAEPMTLPGGFDWGVFAFNAALSLVTGLLFGVGPAWQATRTQVSSALKDSAQTTTRRRRGYAGRAIVGFQVALSTLLVVMAGFFLRTVINLSRIDPGFDPRNIVLFEMRPPQSQYSGTKGTALFRQLEERLATVPGVMSVSPTSVAPLSHSYESDDFKPVGQKEEPGKDSADNAAVGDRYFATFRIPILAGRGFAPTDTETSPKVAVVNQALAKQFFPNENPIGKSFETSDPKNDKLIYQIVGVCADTRYGSLREDPPPVFYLDYRQSPGIDWGMTFAVKTRTTRAGITPSLRRAVQAVDPNLPLIDVRTQEEQIESLLMNERVFADLTIGFGVLALALACIGIYGLMAYTVSRRTNEIGIRMALGARSSQVLCMVLGEAVWMTAVGLAVGLGGALALGRVVASQLYGLKSWDPATLTAAALLLIFVALGATWVPAQRAARVDPSRALRAE
ncbi:MAG: ABC transporter permease [Acidobacteriaceae bacterium]